MLKSHQNLDVEHGGIANLAVPNLIIFVDLQVGNKEVKTADPLYLINCDNVMGGQNVEIKQIVIL